MLSLAVRSFSTLKQPSLNIDQEKNHWLRKIDIYNHEKDHALLKLFPSYNFSELYPTEPGPARWLTNLHKIAQDTPDGVNKIKNIQPNQNMMLLNDPVIKSMMKKSDELDGHSGGTMHWTVHNLSRVYNLGWIMYVKRFVDEKKHKLTRK